jgi:hypothetical protein
VHPRAGKWASTVVTGVKYDKAVATGFWRLFKYISGNNEQQQKVEMTAPVTVRVIPSQGPFCEDNFTISFFVPFDFQVRTSHVLSVQDVCSRAGVTGIQGVLVQHSTAKKGSSKDWCACA